MSLRIGPLVFILALLSVAGPAAAQAPQAPRAPQVPVATCASPLPVLYDQVSPTVVTITSISINPYESDHRLERALGSGVIIDPSGLVLTNSHVVFGRQVLTVTLDDGTTLPATFVGADPIFDVALVRIPTPVKGTLPVAMLGDSSQLVVGEDVAVIGNPLGLDQTLTHGIVSTVNRAVPGAAWSLTEPMIQTDASINPGNSGGPMIDPCGRVVGITTAILPEAQNIGFAVPVNLVKAIIPQLLEKGRVVRPWLGVQGQFVLPELKDLLKVPLVNGFLVEAVEPGSPAEKQGVRGGLFELTIEGQPVLLGGDIITKVNDVLLEDPGKLAKLLEALKVGSTVNLTLFREGKVLDVTLTLTERPILLWDVPARASAAGAGGAAGTTGSAAMRVPTASPGRFRF